MRPCGYREGSVASHVCMSLTEEFPLRPEERVVAGREETEAVVVIEGEGTEENEYVWLLPDCPYM